MRTLRRLLEAGLPILGMLMVFAAILLPSISLTLELQIVVVMVGILLIEAGVWKLTSRILPNERKFLALRAEVDVFIGLVRALNHQATLLKENEGPEARRAYLDSINALHASVDRMGDVAGREAEIH